MYNELLRGRKRKRNRHFLTCPGRDHGSGCAVFCVLMLLTDAVDVGVGVGVGGSSAAIGLVLVFGCGGGSGRWKMENGELSTS